MNIRISASLAPRRGRIFSDEPFQWEIGFSDKNQAFVDATTFLQFSTVSISSESPFLFFCFNNFLFAGAFEEEGIGTIYHLSLLRSQIPI